ncbi:aldo/keto reductase [Candidatus Pelagibacter sp.]|nr:aldo/keto reductase [Candidatus Pelagibacter sp.]
MVKLIYGLAKFSNRNYGFGSRPVKFSRKYFLSYISKYFKIFECSDRYKDSIKYISLTKKKNIHFKIDKIPFYKSEKEILNFFLKKINFYKHINKLKTINVLYLHENNLKIIKNIKVLKTLIFLKKNKLVKNFGASIYSERELQYVLKKKIFAYIQLPINIADSYYFFKYQKEIKNKIIVARSLVLQGTLLTSKINIKYKNQIRKFVNYLDLICHDNKISREELIYRYIFSLKKLNYAMIGSINQKNIKKIIKYKEKKKLNKNLMKELIKVSSLKKNWTNPQKWN